MHNLVLTRLCYINALKAPLCSILMESSLGSLNIE